MQLLYTRAAPGPEFVSLSVVLKSEVGGELVSSRVGDPFILPASLTTISQTEGILAVKELQLYLVSLLKVSSKSNTVHTRKLATSFLQEDEKLLRGDTTQVFRPTKGRGLALHYQLIRDRPFVSALLPLVFNSSRATANHQSKSSLETDVIAVVLGVAMVGSPSTMLMSSLSSTISLRMRDCVDLLGKLGTDDEAATKSLLCTLLLTENESRLNNAMIESSNRTLLTERDPKKKKKKGSDMAAFMIDNDGENPLAPHSSDSARIVVERLAVLSVAENETLFRKYEARERNINTAEKSTKARRRKAARDADLDGFDFRGEKRSHLQEIAQSSSNSTSDNQSVKSNASKFSLKQSKADTRPAMGRSRQQTVPALSAPQKDRVSRNRRGDVGGGTTPRLVNRKGSTEPPLGSNRELGNHVSSSGNGQHSSRSLHDNDSASGRTGSSRSNHTKQHFDPFQQTPYAEDGSDSLNRSQNSSRRSRHSAVTQEPRGKPKVQVNIALNEDLTCFYKLSRMSSCAVEGVIQVQVKSNVQGSVPFYLCIRDPQDHVQSVQENRKFAENVVDSLAQEPRSTRPDHKFFVSVPKADSYFPVMRYKCGSELRPVPIRVQTRVRQENHHWRVALQISSNPHNEDSLTDLTIIMGVPPVVLGESLTTSPQGGVWNASKRSVIWCVSELGAGEKFQLQARFEVDDEVAVDHEEEPKFPVLVRCQCMYAQLSDVEIEVRDIPETMSADVRMKLARRFRLSHRERP